MTASIHPITLPKMGLTMTEGSVSSWNVEVGSTVTKGDEIADIETEKITAPYESPVSGIWRRTIVPIGENTAVGSLIGIVADAEVSEADIDSFVDTFKPVAQV